jgi:hypothetical protein
VKIAPKPVLPVIRDSSSGRRTLRAKQELALEAAKEYAVWIAEQIELGYWSPTIEGSEEAAFLESIRELRKAERGDHAAKKRR